MKIASTGAIGQRQEVCLEANRQKLTRGCPRVPKFELPLPSAQIRTAPSEAICVIISLKPLCNIQRASEECVKKQ